MMGMDWASRSGFGRDLIITFVWTAMICGPIILGLHLFLFGPMNEELKKSEADNKAKIQQELSAINNMNCQQLHDKLLSSDHFYDSDNEAIARDHYVAQCGVRLP